LATQQDFDADRATILAERLVARLVLGASDTDQSGKR
jgi:hypothetical protein